MKQQGMVDPELLERVLDSVLRSEQLRQAVAQLAADARHLDNAQMMLTRAIGDGAPREELARLENMVLEVVTILRRSVSHVITVAGEDVP